jgi:hypothetical protein
MIRMKFSEPFSKANDPVDHKNELTDIVRFSMRLPFSGALFRNQCGALEIEIERVAETHEEYEVLASRFLFGNREGGEGHGQAIVDKAEVIIINPNSAEKEKIQGRFTIGKAQVVDVSIIDDESSKPRETVRIVCTDVKYKDEASGAAATSQAFLVPNF